jgi:Alpha/beta hydrolase of unknown function (DUF900)
MLRSFPNNPFSRGVSMRWLITNRNQKGDGFGTDLDELTFWTLDPTKKQGADITRRSSWTKRSRDDFKTALVAVARKYPLPVKTPPEEQKHLTLFIHGYDNAWKDTMTRYDTIAKQLFDGPASLGELVCFDWPSKGSLLGYLPDREEARKTGDDLTDVLSQLYDWMSDKQSGRRRRPRRCLPRENLDHRPQHGKLRTRVRDERLVDA